MQSVARIISEIREATGDTQESLAHKLDVSFATLNAWERGRRQPRQRYQKAIAGLARDVGIPFDMVVLIVDDDDGDALYLRLTLDKLDRPIEIHTSTTATEGLIQCGSLKPDVIFLDIKMPNLDGIQFAEIASDMQALRHTKIILLTGLAIDDRLRAAAESTMSADVLTKPATTQDLESVLPAVIG